MAYHHNTRAHGNTPQPAEGYTREDWLGLLALATPLYVYGLVLLIGLATGNLVGA